MKLIFLIDRNNDYNYLSNLIEYAIKKKHEVTCLHNYGFNKNTNKYYLYPYVKKSPFYKKIKIIKLDFETKLIDTICKSDFDQIFCKTFPIKNLNNKYLDKINNKINIIMDSIDIYDVIEKIKNFQHCKIRVFCWSKFFKKRIIEYLKEYSFGSYKLIHNKLTRMKNIFTIVRQKFNKSEEFK